jgi:hypothetical protein
MVVAALGLLSGGGGAAAPPGGQRYPASPFVVDVTRPPYSARGDGRTDDTEALQRALNENVGRQRLLFFPKGTYLVSRTLTWPKKWQDRDNWGMTMLRGEQRDSTTIRLKDSSFTDAGRPEAIMWCGGFGSADWFHNYVENLTFDVGARNPGAVALQFYSNNSGAVRNCRFMAAEGSGVVGLDLAHRDMNGPLLVRRCEVIGFGIGIACGRAVNSQTFEDITLRGQRQIGLRNEGQPISIRSLTSSSAVPAVTTYGTLSLVDAELTGYGDAAGAPAIINFNGGRIFLRGIKTTGYRRALADIKTPDSAAAYRITGDDRPGSEGPDIGEYCSQPAASLFPSPAQSLRLAVKETPDAPWDDPRTWANVDAFGADPTGRDDSAPAIQKAMDSGATTVFMPGSYRLLKTVRIDGRVRRVVGLGGAINYGKRMASDFRVVGGQKPVLVIEHFSTIGNGLTIETARTIVFRSVSDCDLTSAPGSEGGELFFEDVVTHNLRLHKQRLWGRQVNIENQGTHLQNDAGDVWVLGYKTERGGTVLETRGGGRSEILGGFSYTTTAGALAPMFVNDDSSVFAFFTEVCCNNDPYATLVSEKRGKEVRVLRRGEGTTVPYVCARGPAKPTTSERRSIPRRRPNRSPSLRPVPGPV